MRIPGDSDRTLRAPVWTVSAARSGGRLARPGRVRSDGASGSDLDEEQVDRTPLVIWAVVALTSVLVRAASFQGGLQLDRWDALAQWDSSTYLRVAERGYSSGDGYVLPGYAAVVRATEWITGELLTAAVLVTYVASAAASWLLWEWLERRGVERRARVLSVLAMLAFPYSFVLFGVVGPEALCLALVLGTFVLIDRGRPVLAGLAASAAMTVMLTAYALLPAIAVLIWMRAKDRSATASASADADASGAIDDAGAAVRSGATWSTLLVSLLGPVAVTLVATWWPGDAALPWTGDGALRGLVTGVLRPTTWVRIGWLLEDVPRTWTAHRGFQALAMVLVAGASYWVLRRFGAAMMMFVLSVVLLTLVGFTDVASAGRRLTAAFPVAGVAGLALARLDRRIATLVLGLSFVAMFTCYVLYLRSVGLPYW